jgi:hypothetical protein
MPAPPASTMPWGVNGSWDLTAWSGPWGVSCAANLTPDRNTGLGIWTEDMFLKAIRTGRHMGVSRQILPPMPWEAFRTMTDDDLRAIFAYLQTLTPIRNHVPDPVAPAQTAAAREASEKRIVRGVSLSGTGTSARAPSWRRARRDRAARRRR